MGCVFNYVSNQLSAHTAYRIIGYPEPKKLCRTVTKTELNEGRKPCRTHVLLCLCERASVYIRKHRARYASRLEKMDGQITVIRAYVCKHGTLSHERGAAKKPFI